MVTTMGVLIVTSSAIFPGVMNSTIPGPVFMALVAIIFSYAVAYIAYQGVNGSTNVNIAINAIQITALVSLAPWRSPTASDIPKVQPDWASMRTQRGSQFCIIRSRRQPVASQCPVGRCAACIFIHDAAGDNRDSTAGRIRIVTAMGERQKNPKRDIPRAVILSLTIQGLICYMFEYFAANYFLAALTA